MRDPLQVLVAALDKADRIAERQRYYDAIMKAINETHDNGVQDGLAMLDTMAIVIAQQLAAADDAWIDGALSFLAFRIRSFIPDVRNNGTAAERFVVPDHVN